MQHLILCDSLVRSLGSSTLCSSVLPRGHRGQDPSDLTPHRHEHLGFISDRAHVAACSQKVLAFVSHGAEKFYLSVCFLFSALPAFHLPPCCSSIFSGLVASRGRLFKLD